MKEIPLSSGFVAIVDDEDFEELSKYKWSHNGHGYADRRLGKRNGLSGSISMHIQIMGIEQGKVIDHINGNGFDNRRCNLRHVTSQQNSFNSKSEKGSSRYKGVSWHKTNKTWQAYIKKDRNFISLGSYKDEIEAAKAYNKAALNLHGEFARLNVIKEVTP